ncbi:hypothetical protein PHISCL_10422, partial [Aspergillus sclerotialis]
APEVAAVASNTGFANTDVAATDVATDVAMSSCYVLTSTITATSVQYVTVTATAGVGGSEDSGENFGTPSSSAVSIPSGGAGQFFGASSSSTSASVQSEGPGGFYGAPSSSTLTSSTTSGLSGLSPSSSISLVAGTPTAGEFFPNPGKGTNTPVHWWWPFAICSIICSFILANGRPNDLRHCDRSSPASSSAA